MGAIMLSFVGIGIAFTSTKSAGRLWTPTGLARVFASAEEVQQRRSPPADQPIRLGGYVVDRRPAELKEGSYNWQTGSYYHAAFNVGTVASADHLIPVLLDLTTTFRLGLGYLCEDPSEGVLAPCRVAAYPKGTDSHDPRVISVGLYQGDAEIGQAGRRFLMSCRYSFEICKAEFIDDWYPGLRVALIFDQKDRTGWQPIVRSAQPEIERIIRRPQ
jgi:hypothetical protein